MGWVVIPAPADGVPPAITCTETEKTRATVADIGGYLVCYGPGVCDGGGCCECRQICQVKKANRLVYRRRHQ